MSQTQLETSLFFKLTKRPLGEITGNYSQFGVSVCVSLSHTDTYKDTRGQAHARRRPHVLNRHLWPRQRTSGQQVRRLLLQNKLGGEKDPHKRALE